MNKKEINTIVRAYLNRNEVFENNHNIGMARARESMIKKYTANRNRQLGTFITDALSLKDIMFDEESPCDNPRFSSGAVEYYALDVLQLENYFSYRTLVKRGDLPTNNHPNFLVLYLMEIVNGIYGNNYTEKRKKLDSLLALYTKGAKYRSLIQEAYEVLYLQNINKVDLDDYVSGIKLPVFKDTSLLNKSTSVSDIPIDDIFNLVKIEKFTAINAKDRFILMDCFEYMYVQLNKDTKFKLKAFDNVENLFKFDYKITFDTPLNKLKAYYPITTKITYSNKKGHHEVIADGVHLTRKVYYDDFRLSQIKKFLVYVVNSIQHICGGIPLPKMYKEDRVSYNYFTSKYDDLPDVQAIIDKYIALWVSENAYARKGYFKSLEVMKDLKERGDFKLDISDVRKVRKQSSDIQDKLIIDDGDSESIIIPRKTTNPFVEHSSHGEDNPIDYFNNLKVGKGDSNKVQSSIVDDNEFTDLINQLTSWEKLLLKALCKNKVNVAEDIAFNNNEMLSLVVDRINTISNDLIEDVIIIENDIVEDYKEELLQALK